MALELWMLLGLLVGVLLGISAIRRFYLNWLIREEAKKLMEVCRQTLYQCASHITNRPTSFRSFVEIKPRRRIWRCKERQILLQVLWSEKDDLSQIESIVTECVTGILDQKGNEKLRVVIEYLPQTSQRETLNATVR
jgi:hypothetical protein